ncbi:tetratricopeptide repeat protein [Clostridiaceae bacterium M8S5]|nr:tetratricopeptide repeat protein [Clostridiaceae bacterium M8S5]
MYFLEDVILPPGEKIRRIRSYLGLRQYEITGGKITRNLISYIENGKTKLVKDTAGIIVESMNYWAKVKNIKLDLDVDYLMRNEEKQAEVLLDRYIKTIKKTDDREFNNVCKKINNILLEWDIIEKKSEYNETVGDYYYQKNDYEISRTYYIKSLEDTIKTSNYKKTAVLYQKLARCSLWTKNYHEVINLNNHILFILDNKKIDDKNIEKSVYFNNALAYYYLGIYDAAIVLIENQEKMNLSYTISQMLDLKILEGSCYFKKLDYKKAQKIYEDVITIAIEKEELGFVALAYMNISNLHSKIGEKEKAADYINKSLQIRLDTDYEYIEEIYLLLGKTYYEIRDYELSEKSLLKALAESKRKRKLSLVIDIYNELLNCYLYSQNNKSINELLNDIQTIIKTEDKKDNQNRVKDILLKASHYYITKDKDKAVEILESSLALMNLK